jgi:hypothetical protein
MPLFDEGNDPLDAQDAVLPVKRNETVAAVVPPDQKMRGKNPKRERELVSDEITERDIAAGRLPSYRIMLRGADGQGTLLTGANGKIQRIRFDPEAAIVYHDADMQSRITALSDAATKH